MGACMSRDDLFRQIENQIDRELEEELKRTEIECKIIMLGPRGSGKSTIFKQMKIIYQDGFKPEELDEYRPLIYNNLLDSAQQVIIYMKKNGFECSNRVLAEKILNCQLDSLFSSGSQPTFSPEIAKAIYLLWKSPVVQKILDDYSSDLSLMDNAAYFFSQALRIGSPGYRPSQTDILRAKRASVGIEEITFTTGQFLVHLLDLGNHRSQRADWTRCFESATLLVFCTALSEYDQVEEREEKTENKMMESIALFDSIVNARWFKRTTILLFLNKIDVFEQKLPTIPLTRCFPKYKGGSDVNKATKYIISQFKQTNRARLTVHPHLTQATETMDLGMIFCAVKETIMQNAIKDVGFM